MGALGRQRRHAQFPLFHGVCTCNRLCNSQFAIASIFAFIVMYDACNVRLETGKQAVAIMELQDLLRKMGEDLSAEEKLKELVGHTLPQVLVGALLGTLIGAVAVLI